MDQRNDSRQWDDLLEKTFGNEGKPDTGFSHSTLPPRKRPFYRKKRLLAILAAFVLVIGAAIWFFLKKSQPEEALSPEDARMAEALETCKNALAQWQAMESCHIKQEFHHYGDTMAAANKVDFWRSGEDFLLLTCSDSLGMINGYLYQGKKMYTAYAYNQQGSDTPFTKPWTEINMEDYENEFVIPWPIGFDWDTNEIQGLSNEYVSDGSGGICLYSADFAVVHDESAYGAQSPYHVNFTFGKGEILESVTVVYTKPGEGAHTSVTTVTFRLGTETESEIEKKIGTTLQMPLDPPPIKTDPA